MVVEVKTFNFYSDLLWPYRWPKGIFKAPLYIMWSRHNLPDKLRKKTTWGICNGTSLTLIFTVWHNVRRNFIACCDLRRQRTIKVRYLSLQKWQRNFSLFKNMDVLFFWFHEDGRIFFWCVDQNHPTSKCEHCIKLCTLGEVRHVEIWDVTQPGIYILILSPHQGVGIVSDFYWKW